MLGLEFLLCEFLTDTVPTSVGQLAHIVAAQNKECEDYSPASALTNFLEVNVRVLPLPSGNEEVSSLSVGH